MKISFCSFWSSFGIALCCLTRTFPVQAQIVPDTTLPHNSQVTTQGNASVITGGTRAGSNLFHSFAQFSVPTGGIAYFNNDLNVKNIVGRVTNSSASNIDGLLRANGMTNLILVNPKGIVFGQNARLSIGGSFLATTANSINFADGTQFSATVPETTPLLTISVPIGLQFGTNQGDILVQGDGQGLRTTSDLIDTTEGLHVPSNQTLALVGSNVTLSGGTLKTAGGRIELGSVTGPGLVSLTQIGKGWALGYNGVQNLGNIQLSQQAEVDTSGEGGGDIQLMGRQVTLTDGSQIEASTLGAGTGGILSVTGSESLELSGIGIDNQVSSTIGSQVYPGASGLGDNLLIKTGRLSLQDGGQIINGTLGTGSAGNLTVLARDQVELSGFSASTNFSSGLFSGVQLGASGNAGNITVNTGQLIVRNGGQISSGTFDAGSSGSITISARDLVELIGTPKVITSIGTVAEPGSEGASGNLTLQAGQLIVRNGAVVSTATFGTGQGGNLLVKAKDSVELSGPPRFGFSSGLSTRSGSTGKAGNLTVQTGRLFVHDQAQVNVSDSGNGNAGFLQINANNINLSNQGSITASSASGQGGNIFLRTQNLQLDRNSSITASAGGSGNGGNITIGTQVLPILDSSAISANAQGGTGGRVTINTQGLFLSPDSSITATSQRGPQFNGIVQVNIPAQLNYARASYAPTQPPQSPQVASVCPSGAGSQSSLVNSGTGGIPATVDSASDNNNFWQGNSTLVHKSPAAKPKQHNSKQPLMIIPVTGVIAYPDGTMSFTAGNASNPYVISPGCSEASTSR